MELQDKGNTPTSGIGPELSLQENNWNDWWQKATGAYMSALQGDGPYCLLDMDKGKKAFEEGKSATAYGIAEATWQNVWITKKRIPSPMISMKEDNFDKTNKAHPVEAPMEEYLNRIGYFTPSIEDIRVGYEGEYQYKPNDWRWFRIEDSGELCDTWETEHGELYLMQMDKYKWLRVPYLTKEQIEKEGWELKGSKDYLLFGYDVMQNFHNAMEKGDYVIQGRSLFGSQHHLKIFDRSDQEGAMCIFEGKCPCINTFRYICKLLGI